LSFPTNQPCMYCIN